MFARRLRMLNRTRLLAASVGLALLFAACAEEEPSQTSTSVPPAAPAATAAGGLIRSPTPTDTPVPAGEEAIPAPTATATPTPPPTPSPAPAATMTPAPEALMIDVLAHPELGDILVGPNGLTLYIFDADAPGVSNCSGGCAAAWPPFEVAGELGVPAAVTATPGTITRDDGATQGTLGGLPLYHFAGDSSPGDTNGHGVSGVWSAVTPAGNAAGVVTAAPEEPEPTEIPPTPTEEQESGGDYGY